MTGYMRCILGGAGLPAREVAHIKLWYGMSWGEASSNLKKITPGDSDMTICILYDNLPSLHTPTLAENHPFPGRPLTEQI